MATTIEAARSEVTTAAAARAAATAAEAAAVPRRMTLAEFEEHPWGEEQVELVRGEVRASPLPAWAHSHIVRTIFLALYAHVSARRLGEVYFDGTGYVLTRFPDTQRNPDVSFVAAERLQGPATLRGAIRVAPDLAVEVISPSDTFGRLEEKLDDYFAAGVRLVWLVHPRRRRVEIALPDGTRRSLGEGDALSGAPVLPDLTLAVGDVFAGVERDG